LSGYCWLTTLSCAIHRFAVTQWLLQHDGCRAAGGRRGSAGPQGVPVVLPLRDCSPGGSYGTAAEVRVSCPAMFRLRLGDRCAVGLQRRRDQPSK
jgi:hypothetical protein